MIKYILCTRCELTGHTIYYRDKPSPRGYLWTPYRSKALRAPEEMLLSIVLPDKRSTWLEEEPID